MSNKMRWRSRETDPIEIAVDSATVIEIGDFLYWDTNDAKPASDQADQGTEALNQALFAENYIGIAMQASGSGDTSNIRVATDGVFEMAAASATYEVGSLVGVDEASGGTALLDQTVAAVATTDLAVGRVIRAEASAATNILVHLFSTVMAKFGVYDIDTTGDGSNILHFTPAAAQQALSGAGAVTITEFYTAITNTGADALTLADGAQKGQLKKIQMIVDPGTDSTLTPATLTGGTTIVFADVGDYALLMWDGTSWVALELGNDADGVSAPVLS